MKPLLTFGFALVLGFLAPLAHAAPVLAASPQDAAFAAPAQPTADDRRADPGPTAPDQRDPDRPPRTDPGSDTPPHSWSSRVRGNDGSSFVPAVTPAPDADADQVSTPVYEDGDTAPADVSGGEPVVRQTHYTIDDLAKAAASLDEPYSSTHFSMDDIGGL